MFKKPNNSKSHDLDKSQTSNHMDTSFFPNTTHNFVPDEWICTKKRVASVVKSILTSVQRILEYELNSLKMSTNIAPDVNLLNLRHLRYQAPGALQQVLYNHKKNNPLHHSILLKQIPCELAGENKGFITSVYV